MKSPGEILRRAREERGWSIEDASRLTCISRTHIQHLEDDAFEEFQDVFARGFIRNYARELDCDSVSVVRSFEHFRAQSDTSFDRSKTSETYSKPSQNPKKKDTSYLRIGLILALLVASVLSVGLFALSNATAEDPTSFADEKNSDSETIENVRKTRWLLEQPENDPERLRR